MALDDDLQVLGPATGRRAASGRGSLKIGSGPLDHLYADAATAPKMPDGHPAAPTSDHWVVPPPRPAPHPGFDARGNPA